MKRPNRTELLLALGAGLGILIAAGDLARAPARALPADAVAVVNGKPIRRADYASALAAVAADRRDQARDPELQRHVLDRLIDEELLVQAALELGLAERDRRVRADLTTAAIGFLTESPVADPSDSELKKFFHEHSGYFARDARLEVRQLFFRATPSGATAARDRALAARKLWLAAERDSELPSSDPAPLPLPSSAMSVQKLEQYVGATLARTAAELPSGAVSEPIRTPDGFVLLRVVRRDGGDVPALSQVRDQVLAEWRRRQSEARLRQFLEGRRARASVVVAGELGS